MKILILDIETSPNLVHVWQLFKQTVSINQILESSYVMCWAAKWYGEKKVLFSSTYKTSHKNMIKEIHSLIDQADAIVTYNGKRFDMPTLNKEFLKYGFHPPSPYKDIDLIQTVRGVFNFPSNKLDYVSQQLNIGKKVSHSGHELWIKCLNNNPKAWATMTKYNKQDVVLTEELYDKIKGWIRNHPNHNTTDEVVCINCGSGKLQKRGSACNTKFTYQRLQCQSCGKWMRSNKALHKKNQSESVTNI